MAKDIKKKDCFFQKRKVKGKWQDPILLEVVGMVFLECVKILKDVENYKNVKRRVVYRIKKFLADTE